ncbi:MAG: recombinase family protein [Rickettsiales bacterium]
MQKQLRCALYLRKACSAEDDASYDTSIIGKEFSSSCQQKFGEAVEVIIYHDMGFSGMHTERPALQRLLQDIAAKRIDVVSYPSLSHLSRNNSDETMLVRYFATHNVQTIDGKVGA